MIVYAVYVISSDGRTIISENFQSTEAVPNEMLLGGLFTALQGVASEMTHSNSEMKSVEIEGLSYHIRSFGFYRVVLVTDLPKTPEDIMQTLGLRFMKEYGDHLVNGIINLAVFKPFKKTIQEIVAEDTTIDDSKSLKPSKKLSTGEIFSLPHHLHSTALAMISLKEATIDIIAKESGNTSEATVENLTSLGEKGFIGKKTSGGETLFFCSL
ncbi:MAG: hypothetical protein ACXAC7_17325 [Candidatus Hodarchaeales archaeon]|jgi:hypothetical protein